MFPELKLLLPTGLIALGGLVALGAEPFMHGRSKHKALPWIAAIFLLLAAFGLVGSQYGVWHGMFALDPVRLALEYTVLACALLGIAGLQTSLARDKFAGGEPYALLLFSTAGILLMVLSVDLLALFVGMELASFPIYALVGLRRRHEGSNEALFKYFVSGAIFSAIFLYGVALIYGATGSTQMGTAVLEGRVWLYQAGLLLAVFGLMFKAGAAPVHFWVADAYTGAPMAVTGYMAAVVKVGAFAALGTLWLGAITGAAGVAPAWDLSEQLTVYPSVVVVRVGMLFLVAALVSIVVGALTGLVQSSTRRILAFSAVANAGFLLLGFVLPAFFANGTVQLNAVWYFLITYALGSAGALVGLSSLTGNEDALDSLEGLRGAARRHPLIGTAVTVCLASLAGLPPAAGFLAKFSLFASVVYAGLWEVAAIAFALAVITAVYYLRIVYALWTPGEREEDSYACGAPSNRHLLKVSLIAVAIALLALTAFPIG